MPSTAAVATEAAATGTIGKGSVVCVGDGTGVGEGAAIKGCMSG